MEPTAEPAQSEPPPAAALARRVNIEFSGSGSEYFRIWIVNMLLMLLTLGLYFPFAKARRIRYFCANTWIDGQALAFHGSPRRMFRGFLLLVGLVAAYSMARRYSALSSLVAFAGLALVGPALWRASLQFRIGNTSWRGMRMAFEGRTKDAYLVLAPVYLPLFASFGAAAFTEMRFKEGLGIDHMKDAIFFESMLGLLAIPFAACAVPWLLTMVRRYQQNGLRLADQQAALDLPSLRFYGLCGSIAGFFVFIASCLTLIVMAASKWELIALDTQQLLPAVSAWALLLIYLIWFLLLAPYFGARSQNLVWSSTRSRAVTFKSQLTYAALLKLTWKNWLLVLLTLGLYRPFAVIDTARLKLQAVELLLSEDPAQWNTGRLSRAPDASGEVAGDFFGIDLGL